MAIALVAPSLDLAPVVRVFVDAEIGEAHGQLLMPEPGMVLALRYRGSVDLVDASGSARLASASLMGVAGRARTVYATARGGVVLVMFRTTGAAGLFSTPPHALNGRLVSLDDVDLDLARSRTGARLLEQLAAAVHRADRIALVESFLRARARTLLRDPLVDAAVRAIHASGGGLRVGALASALGLSQDRLEKRFRGMVGATPKQFASLVRFRRVVSAHSRASNLGRLAQDAGYFDQSHLVRAFRAFTGQSPTAFLSGSGCARLS